MIRILFFIDTLTGGGAEKVLQTLVNNMDQSKFSITVHTVEYTDPTGILSPGIRYRAINRCRTALGRKLFSYWIRLCAQLKWLYPLYIRDDYDIEVAYLECGPTKIIAGSTNKKAKKLAWVHCDLCKRESLANQAETLKKYYEKYDKVLCVSETVRESYESLFGKQPEAVVVHNVIDETQILQKAAEPISEERTAFTFVSVGRLSREKGNDRLLEAAAMLKRDGFDFRVWLVGEGPERDNLQKQMRDAALDDCVTFFGFRDNPYPYMAAADVVVCASRYEGFSTVMTEAMILGKAAVTTPCSGMRELFGDSQYGLIVQDHSQALYQGMKSLLEDPRKCECYTRAAAQRGTDFRKERLVSRTEEFFCCLLET